MSIKKFLFNLSFKRKREKVLVLFIITGVIFCMFLCIFELVNVFYSNNNTMIINIIKSICFHTSLILFIISIFLSLLIARTNNKRKESEKT